MGVLFPLLQSNCFPVTVAVSCSNLVLKILQFYVRSCRKQSPQWQPHYPESVPVSLPFPMFSFAWSLLRVSPPVNLFSFTQEKSWNFSCLWRLCLCFLRQSLPNRERKKTCFCWSRHVILMLSRLTETQQSNGIWTKFRCWHQRIHFWSMQTNKMPFH